MVGDVDPHAIALDRLDRGAVDAAVVAPALGYQAGRKLVLHLLGDEVVDFHPVHELPRQRDVVGRDDRRVVLTRLPGRQGRLRIDPLGKRLVSLRRGGSLARAVRPERWDPLGGADVAKQYRAAAERGDPGEELAAVN